MPNGSGAENIKELQMQQSFLLTYYLGFTYQDVQGLPIKERLWYIERLREELEQKKENDVPDHRAAHNNTPEMRALQSKARESVPARLRRL